MSNDNITPTSQVNPTYQSLQDGAPPRIQKNTVHAMIIDAGSMGSRMHVYEYDPRVLETSNDVGLAASGRKLTYPTTNSLWTQRLSPGLNMLASIKNDTELITSVVSYLAPLLEFAKEMLNEKQRMFSHFPIYLHATGGMRELKPEDRMRIMLAVHSALDDQAFNPFAFTHEYARVISGEEEAVFGWTAINFLMQTLLNSTVGQGTVVNPSLTYGALDMGGASTQISFFDPRQDVMSNLFKLQIGASRHWNIYAHSYLKFGVVSAYERLNAKLYSTSSRNSEIPGANEKVIYNPCLPGKESYNFTSNINFGSAGIETQSDIFYTVQLANPYDRGDFNKCSEVTYALLEKASDAFCIFSHNGDCAFAGVYQPELPSENSNNFGEFVAFGNFYHVWKSLQLDPRSNLRTLHEKAIILCSMSLEELILYNENYGLNISRKDLPECCFRSVFAFQMFHKGFGFSLDSNITAVHELNGQKLTWALGAILYEINTRPWIYLETQHAVIAVAPNNHNWLVTFITGFLFYVAAIPFCFILRRRKVATTYTNITTTAGNKESIDSNTSTVVISNVNNGYGSLY